MASLNELLTKRGQTLWDYGSKKPNSTASTPAATTPAATTVAPPQRLAGNPTNNFDQGGVRSIGVIEPFNQFQKDALSGMGTYNPQMVDQGYMQGNQQAYQAMLNAATGLPVSDLFSRGSNFYGTAQNNLASANQQAGLANSQIQQGARELTDQDFASGISRYMNPYTQNVLDSSINRINQNAATTQSNLMANQAGRRSFGDSSSAIQLSELARNQLQQVGDTSAQLNYQGYTDAANNTLGEFNNERNRNLQAAQGYLQGGNLYNQGASIAAGAGGDSYNQGFQGLNALGNVIGAGNAANSSYINNFNANKNNQLQNYQSQYNAGSAIQGQNQRSLDVVSGNLNNKMGFDNANLQNLAQFLNQFPGSNNGYVPAGPSSGQQIGGALQTAGGLLGQFGGGGIPGMSPTPLGMPAGATDLGGAMPWLS